MGIGNGISFFSTSDTLSNRTEAITVSEYGTVRYQRERKKINIFYLPNRKGCKYRRQKEKANLFNNCSSLFCLEIHERLGKEDPKQ
jgi:hypothetical protein